VKKEKIDLSQERRILIYMIVSTEFLSHVRGVIRKELFKNSFSRLLFAWITEFFDEYKTAPGKNMQGIYDVKYKNVRDEDDLEMLSTFIKSLSDEWERLSDVGNVQAVISESLIYFRIRSLFILKEKIEKSVVKNDPLYGENAVADYSKIVLENSTCVNLLRDSVAIVEAFTDKMDVVLEFPGILGEVCGPFLRGDLVSFLAPMKRGKSWWLMYTAVMGAMSGLHTLFISLEMNQNQVVRRFWQCLKARPKKGKEIEIPYFIESEYDDDKFEIRKKKKKIEGVDVTDVPADQKNIRMFFKSGNIRILTFPASSATVGDLENSIDNLGYYENYHPEIVVIDYADNLRTGGKYESMQYRHQLDHIWKTLRGAAQKRCCCYVTASQSAKSAFSNDITEEMVAEDIRKLAHVSKMIAINQNQEDRENNIIRIAQLAEREEGRNLKQACVLQCLDIGNPCVDSRYVDDIYKNKKKRGKK